jgi:hypothetical protein
MNTTLPATLMFFFVVFFSPGDIVLAEVEHFFKEESEKPLEYVDVVRASGGASYKGVIFGNIISVDPQYRFIFVKPKEFDLPRMFIFIDPLTRYTNSKVGFKKRSSYKRLLEGDRVAVRVFTKQGVMVADEVFYIEGEFEAPSKYEKKTYTQAPLQSTVQPASHGASEGAKH